LDLEPSPRSRTRTRITGDDSEGVDQLSNFIDPESKCPVIVTTSRLLSTGIDAQTCRLIVFDREVGSMTEFKQIAGRGTRVHEDSRPCRRHCEGLFVPALA
jgi:type I restriction enzyme R subunit